MMPRSKGAVLSDEAGSKTPASGLLSDLIASLRRSRKGDLVAVTSFAPNIGSNLRYSVGSPATV
jgi:hypothetical protein